MAGLQFHPVRDTLGQTGSVAFVTSVLLSHAPVEAPAAVESLANLPHSLVDRLPDPDAPTQRVGGGGPRVQLSPQVLAPESVSVTNPAQPILYWFRPDELPYPLELAIIDDQHIEPLFDVRLRNGFPAVIHQLALADYAFRLRLGGTYRQALAAIVDPANRSRDLAASGAIRHVEPKRRLPKILKSSPTAADSVVYGENNGI